jgi:hypothetical protein
MQSSRTPVPLAPPSCGFSYPGALPEPVHTQSPPVPCGKVPHDTSTGGPGILCLGQAWRFWPRDFFSARRYARHAIRH